jgi:hypothetical protein
VASAADRTIGLISNLTVTASITETTQAALGMSTTLPIAVDISSAIYPTLESFTVTLDLTAITVDYTDVGTAPDRQPISCTVTFTPRLKPGQTIWVPGMGIMLASVKARCDPDGVLRTIAGGTGVELIANTPLLELDQLIYDVTFENVVYAKADQQIAPFAFEAPTTPGTFVDLSRVDKLAPQPPSWYPAN